MKAAEGRVAQAKNLGDQRALLGSLENRWMCGPSSNEESVWNHKKWSKLMQKTENGWTSPKVIFYIVLLRNIP